jgi:hypothetical protein
MAKQSAPNGTHPIVVLLNHQLLHRSSFQLEFRLFRDVPERLDESFEFAVGMSPASPPCSRSTSFLQDSKAKNNNTSAFLAALVARGALRLHQRSVGGAEVGV